LVRKGEQINLNNKIDFSGIERLEFEDTDGNFLFSWPRGYAWVGTDSIRVTIDDDGEVVGYNDYYPFGLQMPQRNMNNALSSDIYKFSGKELDEENGLDWYYFGARYYDSAIGRWFSPDPLTDLYPSHAPYNYVLNNPIKNFDPDGRSTYTDSSGNVLQVTDDDDLNVYQFAVGSDYDGEYNTDDATVIGQTEFWDEFETGNILNLEAGSLDATLAIKQYKYIIALADKNPLAVGFLSSPAQPLDVKTTLGASTGYLYDGYWMTGQSVGNRFAGKNAALIGQTWDATITTAGLLHMISNKTVKDFNFRYYGETNYAGRQIQSGFNSIKK
jgi:RHS repeat-associated protein